MNVKCDIDAELQRRLLEEHGIILKSINVESKCINAIVYSNSPSGLTSAEKIKILKNKLVELGLGELSVKYKTVKLPDKRFEYKKKVYERNATQWAEKHGIVEYRVQSKYMVYNVSYPAVACEPRRTYQFKIDLETGKTVESKQLKRYDPNGVYNRP